jgi:hypothetical protein
MVGGVGWEFDQGPLTNGKRGLSSTFFNDNNSIIQALDGSLSITVGSLTIIESQSYLIISATNVINKGLLTAGPAGEIVLTGQNALLSRSQIEITPIVGAGSSNTRTNFTADTGIYDEYWTGGSSNRLTVTGSPWDGTTILGPTLNNAGEPCATATIQFPSLTPQLADSFATNVSKYTLTYTNMTVGTTPNTTTVTLYSNIVHQAVFVLTSDPKITALDGFDQSLSPTNYFRPVVVRLSTVSTDAVSLLLQTNTLYLLDFLASSTNRALLTNSLINIAAACTSPTLRPDSLILSRLDPDLPSGPQAGQPAFASSSPGAGPPSSAFFYDPLTFSNNVAFGIAAAYSALVDNLVAEPPASGLGQNITNAPGRINIYAHDLDLTKARVRAEAEIVIQATNLISSTNAAIDCQNLSYNLGSTNGFLNVTNLAALSVNRLHGTISEYSALWTNHIIAVFPNYSFDMTTSNFDTPAFITNSTEIDLNIVSIDASGLSSTIPVTVQDLALHSTNMIVSDSMDVSSTLLFDGQSLTLQGNFNLINVLQNWTYTIAPTLRYFTNNGTLDIPNEAHFGDDGPTNYATFVNQGDIFSASQTINADYLQVGDSIGSGSETFAGDFLATCKTGVVVNAEIISDDNIQFFADSLLLNKGSVLLAFNTLDFTVTDSLSDGGFTANNLFECQNGFNLSVKPAVGDLLGTTIDDIAIGQSEVGHLWAGNDFGTNVVGYMNNVAIGTLALITNGVVSPGNGPLFHFTGTGADNGMYVSNLDLSMLDDYANEIQIDPNITIYFISAKLNPGVNTGIQTPEQFLDGQFGGHLRWMQGVTSLVTKTTLSGNYKSGNKFQINLSGVSSGQTNIIEASTNLVNWIPIYTNTGFGSMIFTDSAAGSFHSRFYRTRTLP